MTNDAEKSRVEALLSYNILDSTEEEDFDNLVKLAASICETEFAQINFIASERQWTKAWHGIDIKEIPREYGFCNHTIEKERDSMIISNALKDDRFKERDYVVNNPKIRFYAGVNIKSNEGHNIGTVCVLGTKAKEITPQQKNALEILAKEVEMRLELRKSQHNLKKKNIYLNNSTDLMMLVESSNFEILEVNKEVKKYFNYDEKDLLGRSLHNLRFDKSDVDKLSLWIKYNSEDTFSEIIKVSGKRNELFLQVDATLKSNLIFITARDITEQQLNLLELKKNFKFQEFLSQVALIFDSLDTFDSKMNQTLEILGEVCNVNRTYVFINFNNGKNCKNEYEWCKKGVIPQIDELQDISYELDVPEWKETLLNEGEIICSDIRLLPIPIQEILKPQNIKSIIVLPLIIDVEFFGFIGFDDTENNRAWTDSELYLLKTVSVLMSNAYKEKIFSEKLKSSEQRLKRFIKQAPVAIAMLDTNLCFMEASTEWISEFTEGTINVTGLHYSKTSKRYKGSDEWKETFETVLEGNTYSAENTELKLENGDSKWISSKIIPWYNDISEIGGIIIYVEDVTNQNQDRIQIEKSLKEKEALLGEIHHRVKNNLAVISAFLQLEELQSSNEDSVSGTEKNIGRIKIMASIHELLYKNDNFSEIDLGKMTRTLVEEILANKKIIIEMEADEILVTINKAVPFALLLNEVVTDSISYMSSEADKVKFMLSIKLIKNAVSVSIRTNQKRSETQNPLNLETSFSGVIIKTLAAQIQADLSFDTNTSCWLISFDDSFIKGSSSTLDEKDILKN